MRRICDKKPQVCVIPRFRDGGRKYSLLTSCFIPGFATKQVADSESTDAFLDPDSSNVPSICYLQYLSNIEILPSEKQLTVRGK